MYVWINTSRWELVIVIEWQCLCLKMKIKLSWNNTSSWELVITLRQRWSNAPWWFSPFWFSVPRSGMLCRWLIAYAKLLRPVESLLTIECFNKEVAVTSSSYCRKSFSTQLSSKYCNKEAAIISPSDFCTTSEHRTNLSFATRFQARGVDHQPKPLQTNVF